MVGITVISPISVGGRDPSGPLWDAERRGCWDAHGNHVICGVGLRNQCALPVYHIGRLHR